MKFFIFLLILIPFNSIISQQRCCEFLDQMLSKKRFFKTIFNSDSTNYCLVVTDTTTERTIFEYDYGLRNPLLNLKGDYFGETYRLEIEAIGKRLDSILVPKPKEKGFKKRHPDSFFEDQSLRRSKYQLKDFDIDSIDFRLRNLVHDLDFPYFNKSLNIHISSTTIYVKPNKLQTIITNVFDSEPFHYAIVQNLVQLYSGTNSKIERKLDVINSKGNCYSITEKFRLNERLKAIRYSFAGVKTNDFDIIESDSTTYLITYLGDKINVYDLNSKELFAQIDSKVIISKKFKALKVNSNVIAFIPKPIRVGGYDMKKHFGIKGNHIDFSCLKDYDDTITQLIVFDAAKNRVYTKKYRIDEIESIQGFNNLSIVFDNGKKENIESLFNLQEKNYTSPNY